MKLRWKILIGLGIFLLLVALSAWFTANRQPQSEVSIYLDSLRARGEKLEIAEVIPRSVPTADNCADAVQMAFGSLGSAGVMMPTAMRMVAPGKAMAAWQQPDVRGWNNYSGAVNAFTTNSWDDLTTNVATFLPALDLLQEVFDRPELDFNLDYKKGAYMPLPHLSPFKRSAQALSAAAILNLHNGDTGGAATNICTLLALVHANHDEGTVISHLVHIAIVAITVNPTWDFLQSTNATDAQLAWLQKNWEQLEFVVSTEKAAEMERAMMKQNLERARADSAEFDHMLGVSSGGGPSSSGFGSSWPVDLDHVKYQVGKAVWRASWSYTEEVRYLQADQIMLETMRTMETNSEFLKPQYDTMQTNILALGLTNVGAAFFSSLKIPDFSDDFGGNWMGALVGKTIHIEAARRVVIAAIALKRFQLKHGAWPQTLNELAPEFIVSVPVDPFDGKPLRYHPNPDGTYLLYSVGEDGVDDGGDPTSPATGSGRVSYWNNSKARDWVWPQPATEAEIKYFYDHPPK
ncbi:MAG TPA: hypothetical protein VK742_07100 [Candidatus Sulfotelmatobacter sp.]|jgi:hypothetical protein|nr:hypothetical protein [Candidatus Sulfotelmatobacter sp.]